MFRHLFMKPLCTSSINVFSLLLFLMVNYTFIKVFTFLPQFSSFSHFILSLCPTASIFISCVCVCVCHVCSSVQSACSSMYLLSIFSVYLKVSFSLSQCRLHFFFLLQYNEIATHSITAEPLPIPQVTHTHTCTCTTHTH